VTALLLSLSLILPPGETYRALFLRAAPGHLVELIDVLKSGQAAMPPDERGLLLRHSQGDQWDLLLLTPIGSMGKYFGKEHPTPAGWDALVAWQEELFAGGPAAAEFRAATEKAGYFHLEIFQALAGKRDSLTREREMENAFLASTGKPVNFVFSRVSGASWDLFTLGLYRDLQHYAEPASVPPDREEAAARAAGFDSRSAIGPYLRRFINSHHDTIGGIVR
jgi:hypothetical protein